MTLDKTKNTVRNTFWGFVNQILQNLLPFVTRTLLIKLLGSEYLGLNSLFSSILQILNLAEAGFGVAIVYSMYKPIAEDDKETICALLSLFRKIYRIVGTVITLAGLCVLPFLKYLIKSDYPSDVNIYILYCIYLANTSLSYFMFAYKNSLFNAFQRNDKLSQVDTFISILKPAAQIVLLLFFRNLYVYTVVIPLMTLAKNILVSFLASKVFPEYVCRGSVSKDVKKDIYKRVSGLFISKLSQTTRDSFDSIFISVFISLSAVTIYSNYYYIMNAVHGFLTIICTSMSAGIGNYVASESRKKSFGLLLDLNFLYLIIAGWCFICLMGLYQPFMYIWVGESLMFGKTELVLMCLYFYLLSCGDVIGSFSGAFGMWWDYKYCSIFETLGNLVLNFIFAKNFGIKGILLGTVINLFLFNFLIKTWILIKKQFSLKDFYFYLIANLKYGAVTFVILLVIEIFVQKFLTEYTISNFVIRILICFLAAPALYLLIYAKKIRSSEMVRKIVTKTLKLKKK